MSFNPNREWTDGGDIVLKSCIEEDLFSIEEICELLKRSEESVKERIFYLLEKGQLSKKAVEELDKSA